jgi:NHL repeat
MINPSKFTQKEGEGGVTGIVGVLFMTWRSACSYSEYRLAGITNYPIGVGINSAGEIAIADNHNNFNLTVFTQDGQVNSLKDTFEDGLHTNSLFFKSLNRTFIFLLDN